MRWIASAWAFAERIAAGVSMIWFAWIVICCPFGRYWVFSGSSSSICSAFRVVILS
jgi:hypothetical protein